jgi:hypothetical protein
MFNIYCNFYIIHIQKIVYIGYDSFSFYLSIAVLLQASLYFYILLLLMPVSGSVLLLYAVAHTISLKYLFPEKMFIEVCCQKCAHSYGKVKGKGVIFLTDHIQCKQSLSPRSLELRGNFQMHR